MRLPTDISGKELVNLLSKFGYRVVRQTGSHIRLSTSKSGEHHVTVPDHDHLRIGTLSGILSDIAEHFNIPRDALIDRLMEK